MNNRGTLKVLAVVIAVLLAIAVLPMTAAAADAPKSTTKVSASTLAKGRQLVLTNMPYNTLTSPSWTSTLRVSGKALRFRSMQNFDYTPDGKYLFTTAECITGSDENKNSTKHTMLTRNVIPTDGSKEAVCVDARVLENYGHGETIAITQPDLSVETYDIWVACDRSNKSGKGINIARMTYSVDANGVGTIIKTVKIKNWMRAGADNGKATYLNPKYGKKATIERLGVAIETNANKIAFRVCFIPGQGCNYVFYDFSKLNSALDELSDGQYFDITAARGYQRANVRTSLKPTEYENGLFQSFDIDGQYLYTCGGHTNKGAGVYKMRYKTYAAGKVVRQQLVKRSSINQSIVITPQITIDGTTYKNNNLEIEGMKVVNNGSTNYYYINFYVANLTIKDKLTIFRFTK